MVLLGQMSCSQRVARIRHKQKQWNMTKKASQSVKQQNLQNSLVKSREYKVHITSYTVLEAAVGGINKVKPPSMQSRFLNIVAGRGARYLQWYTLLVLSFNLDRNDCNPNSKYSIYPGIKDEVKTALIRSSLESN